MSHHSNLHLDTNFKSFTKYEMSFKEVHNSGSDASAGDEKTSDTQTSKTSANNQKTPVKAKDSTITDKSTKTEKSSDNPRKKSVEFNSGSIHYVDACTLWKFPTWLVDRLQCSKIIENVDNVHPQQIQKTFLEQLRSTSTDLLMYATVRREFLRTILLIELNNVARLLEVSKILEIDKNLKARFFDSLKPCIAILDDDNKSYSQTIVDLAVIIDEIYVSISPSHYIRESNAYTYNNVYCSYLVPGSTLQFTEICCGGIVDNTWFSVENKYKTMVMVTPHVMDDPRGIQVGLLKEEKFRVEAYFDVSKGRYTAFDKHFKSTISLSFRHKIILEHLVFNFFSKSEHYVEEKTVFLMNGPESKGNLTFAKIYHSLVKSAVL